MTPLLVLAALLGQPARPPGEVALTVSPPPAGPPLRYELLPRPRDRQPGNAAVHWLRAAALRPPPPADPKLARELADTLARWEELPLDAVPGEKLREYLRAYRDLFAEADEAARCDRCDWQPAGRRADDLARLLPVVQAQRELMRLLAFRARADLSAGRFDPAARALQTGFQAARHAADGATVVQLLVGVSIGQAMAGRCDDWAGRPAAPSLYWPLAQLPKPLLDPRPALDGESRLHAALVPGLEELDRGPVSEQQAKRVLEAAIDDLTRNPDRPDAERAGLEKLLDQISLAAYLTVAAPAARKELVARGRPAKEAEAMPAAQVLLLRAIAVHRDAYEEQVKLFAAPFPFARAELDRLDRQAKERRDDPKADPLVRLTAIGFPAVSKVHLTHARLDRKLAQLQAVEAVRLHLAKAGDLPAALAEVTLVPVPDDPFTGKPFGYARTADGFALTGPPPDARPESGPADVYRVTVRK